MVELIVVIMLLGILAAYAQSRLSTEPYDERYLYDDIISALQYTQKLSIGSGCQVEFSMDASGYALNLDTNCETDDAAAFTTAVTRPLEPTVPFLNNSFPPSLSSVSDVTIVFYPQGWACDGTGNNTGSVSISVVGQVTRAVQVICSTGYIREV